MLTDTIHDAFVMREQELHESPITPDVTPEEIRSYLTAHYDFEKQMSLDEVIADVEKMLKIWQVQVTHPRYFGLFNPSVTFASVIADTLVAMYNPQLASWRTSPAANEVERFTLDWIAAKFGLPKDTIGTFTSGGAEANHSAVIVALTRAFSDYGDKGLRCLGGVPTVYLSREAHHSFAKIAHMTGLGRRALRVVATDDHLRMNLADLERKVAEDRLNGLLPFMVVGTCGTTTAGAIDPLPEIGDFCNAQELWFHVDAAWGGAAILAPSLRQLLDGIHAADSVTCDAHKWFSVPMGCGMFFCRHRESVFQAFRADAAYMPAKGSDATFDPYTSSIQWSRRFIGLKLFVSLAVHGESGQSEMIENQIRMGQLLRELLAETGWHIVNETPLPLVCFTKDALNISEFLASLRKRQIAWMSEAQINGIPVVRACVTSFKTTERDVRWVVSEMNRLVAQDAGSQLITAGR
ncbi:MAG: pyridoxal-dependent decarboxylase [Terracidiphilus sp.]